MPAPSLQRMCWRPRQSLAGRVAYFVRSFRTCARIRSLTTGTFNLIVKDRISTPPERRESVRPKKSVWRGRLARDGPKARRSNRQSSTVLETLQTYRCAQNPVNPRIAQDLHRFSTTGKALFVLLTARDDMAFRLTGAAFQRAGLFRPCEGGRQKLKELTFGGSLL